MGSSPSVGYRTLVTLSCGLGSGSSNWGSAPALLLGRRTRRAPQ
ncbi:hypothetical protein Mal64_34260 [Pseudobythopirellula maris]|uniref:Uncharacterized protein n=1 Tax=Pseudobythopirellula maris TaxID=2527991 RepID=A0A5C5ZGR1_9BACT|nr:hypothetical protein Mal64_34260 [Pseudobythopirellula maris]